MVKQVRIEFEESDGHPQDKTIKLWINSEEITDPLIKGTLIKIFTKNLPWQINPCESDNQKPNSNQNIVSVTNLPDTSQTDRRQICLPTMRRIAEIMR